VGSWHFLSRSITITKTSSLRHYYKQGCGSGFIWIRIQIRLEPVLDSDPVWIRFRIGFGSRSGLTIKAGSGSGFKWIRIHNPDYKLWVGNLDWNENVSSRAENCNGKLFSLILKCLCKYQNFSQKLYLKILQFSLKLLILAYAFIGQWQIIHVQSFTSNGYLRHNILCIL
jgi:hypothetical protein